MLLVLLLALPTASRASLVPGQHHHNRRHQIEQLEDTWRTAILAGDTAVLDSLMDADYMAITADGTLLSREQTLADLRDGAIRFSSIEVSDRKVRFFGTTALVTSRVEVKGNYPSGEVSGNFRYTRVYVRDASGKWKIVHFEASRIRN